MSLYVACQHGAAADKYGRHIDPGCSHQKPRHIFIAVGNHNKGVKLVGQRHALCRICNQVSCYQRIFHADMAHGNAVADCNSRKHHRSTSCHGYAQFYSLHNFIQIHMARHDLIIGAYNTHHGLFHLFFRHSKGIKQGAVRRLLHTGLYCITFHMSDLLLWGYFCI